MSSIIPPAAGPLSSSSHLWVLCVKGLHHLLDNKVGVVTTAEASPAHGRGDTEVVKESLLFYHIVGIDKVVL